VSEQQTFGIVQGNWNANNGAISQEKDVDLVALSGTFLRRILSLPLFLPFWSHFVPFELMFVL
jgi:hypothetical protein